MLFFLLFNNFPMFPVLEFVPPARPPTTANFNFNCSFEILTPKIMFFLLLIFCLLLFLVFFCAHGGLFTTITVKSGKPSFNQLTIAYKYFLYSPQTMKSFIKEQNNFHVNYKRICVYYTCNNDVIPKSIVIACGIIISENEIPNKSENLKFLSNWGYKMFTFPCLNFALMTTHPLRNVLSERLAIWRVYPKINSYIVEKSLCAHPLIEIYEEKQIVFIIPLIKQHKFYVPEAIHLLEYQCETDEDYYEQEHGNPE